MTVYKPNTRFVAAFTIGQATFFRTGIYLLCAYALATNRLAAAHTGIGGFSVWMRNTSVSMFPITAKAFVHGFSPFFFSILNYIIHKILFQAFFEKRNIYRQKNDFIRLAPAFFSCKNIICQAFFTFRFIILSPWAFLEIVYNKFRCTVQWISACIVKKYITFVIASELYQQDIGRSGSDVCGNSGSPIKATC